MTGDETARAPLVALIDDEEDITTYLGLALEDAGYRVEKTNEAGEALALLQRSAPDLICLDLLMPDRTGVSLYAEICSHEQLGRVPVLILSGLGEREELSRMLTRAGELPAPAGFIDKPVEIESFLATLRELLAPPAGAGGEAPGPEPEGAPP
jgi:DNA-binding response OmpR family regulator